MKKMLTEQNLNTSTNTRNHTNTQINPKLHVNLDNDRY